LVGEAVRWRDDLRLTAELNLITALGCKGTSNQNKRAGQSRQAFA
jgi:hypothetical protein